MTTPLHRPDGGPVVETVRIDAIDVGSAPYLALGLSLPLPYWPE